MASIRELEGRVVASERVNALGPPALLAVFREMRCRIKPSVDYPPALLFFSFFHLHTVIKSRSQRLIHLVWIFSHLSLSVHLSQVC